MAKGNILGGMRGHVSVSKKTSIGRKNIKMASMNKSKKTSFKKYRGQGK